MSNQVVPATTINLTSVTLHISDAMQAIEDMMMGDTLNIRLSPVMLTRIDLDHRPIVYGKW